MVITFIGWDITTIIKVVQPLLAGTTTQSMISRVLLEYSPC